jgi:hypothetical protein
MPEVMPEPHLCPRLVRPQQACGGARGTASGRAGHRARYRTSTFLKVSGAGRSAPARKLPAVPRLIVACARRPTVPPAEPRSATTVAGSVAECIRPLPTTRAASISRVRTTGPGAIASALITQHPI